MDERDGEWTLGEDARFTPEQIEEAGRRLFVLAGKCIREGRSLLANGVTNEVEVDDWSARVLWEALIDDDCPDHVWDADVEIVSRGPAFPEGMTPVA